MPYKKPKGLLKDLPSKRITPKSRFLKKLEEKQAELAHPKVKQGERVLSLLEGYKERRK
ncbi:MAG TPA: hypothetical protein VHK27_05540 [Gammaproteobacteria bacterium]|nr:hypothetical protein [Gammaproteobacteria bacterium]